MFQDYKEYQIFHPETDTWEVLDEGDEHISGACPVLVILPTE